MSSIYYERQILTGHYAAIGLRLFERNYPVGVEDAAQTDIAGWLGYNLQKQGFDLVMRYDYTFYLFDHEPILSLHEPSLSAYIPLSSWLELRPMIGFTWQDVLKADYQRLEALGAKGRLTFSMQWEWLRFDLGYELNRNWAQLTESQLSSNSTPMSPPVNFYTDYTNIVHGPLLGIEVDLPWKLQIETELQLLWYLFSTADRFTIAAPSDRPADEIIIYEVYRRDVWISATFELSRPLAYGFEVLLNFSLGDNHSNLDKQAPLDRNYSRMQGIFGLRWHWRIF